MLGDIQRMLLDPTVDPDVDRNQIVLHASEMSKPTWCPRASYYRITGAPAKGQEKPYFQLETIFEEGHDIQSKWERWINRLGRLRGLWECLHCGHTWWATSPPVCAQETCGSKALAYREVPIFNAEYLIEGHADGDIDEGNDDIADDPLLEVKSIGIGTVRVEAPHLLTKYTHKIEVDGEQKTWTDLDRLWRNIRRPFPSHLRQGLLYCFLLGRRSVVFIYEFKPTQAVKEFVVRYQPHLVEDVLDLALDVQFALKRERPPARPVWATEPDVTVCKACIFRDTCWGTSTQGEQSDEGEERRRGGTGEGQPEGEGGSRTRRPVTRRQAALPDPEGADPVGGTGRPDTDAPVRGPHSLGRLLERATRPGSGGRGV